MGWGQILRPSALKPPHSPCFRWQASHRTPTHTLAQGLWAPAGTPFCRTCC